MASSINASTAGAGGVITTADNSGVLNLQSGGTTVATVSSSGFATPANQTINTANTFGFKNRIINGGMVIDQRNAGASVATTTAGVGTFTIDRWGYLVSVASKFTVQQNAGSVTPPAGFINYLGATSSAATTLAAGDFYLLYQPIEGLNMADLGWGTVNAKTITISFQVYSSLTGTFGGALRNSAQNRSYPFTYTISSANTWTQISVTIAGDTSGTWLTTNGVGVYIDWSLGTGTTYSGTAGSWAAANYLSATGATSIVGTSGATFYITGVQLEVGSQATSFDFRDYGRELILCQRYYEQLWQFTGKATSSTGVEGTIGITVTKRTTPTMSILNGTNTLIELGVATRTFTAVSGGGVNGGYCVLTTSGVTAPNMCVMYSTAAIAASAEL
jgi:hypothetical protein